MQTENRSLLLYEMRSRDAVHSVINQRQCHEQCKLGGTLCLVLLVTGDTVIVHRNIDTQTLCLLQCCV